MSKKTIIGFVLFGWPVAFTVVVGAIDLIISVWNAEMITKILILILISAVISMLGGAYLLSKSDKEKEDAKKHRGVGRLY